MDEMLRPVEGATLAGLLMPGAVCTAEDVIGFCTGHLARYKIPRAVVFVTEWPMSATKIQKFRLREMLPAPVTN